MIVVGAGIIGLSCAWALARAGRAVRVFDKGTAAREASWAGAGMLAPGGEYDADSEVARMALRSRALYPSFVAELKQETGLDIDLRLCGAVEASRPGHEAEVERTAQARVALGIASEPCLHNGQPARFYPDDALVDPRHLTRALIAACRARGVELREHEPVTEIAPDGRSLRTPLATYRDDAILVAAGAWSSQLHPALPATRPVRGHLVSWQLPPGFLPTIVRNNGTYLMQRSSGTLIAGSSTENAGFDRTLDPAIVADIVRRATELVPELKGLEPTDRWNGFRPATDAPGPLIGPVAGTSLWTAFGHYRNGILLAPETARMLAALKP